jgi:hypothetical protein
VNAFLNIQAMVLPVGASLKLLCAVTVGFPDHSPPKAVRQTADRITWVDF